MSNWQKVRLGDICTLHYGKALTATKRVAGDVPVYSSAGITGWHNKSLIDSRSIIVGRKGTVGSVYLCETPFWCIDTAYYILPNDDVCDFKYLYYRLLSLGLTKLNEDSAVPGLNRETAYSQEFSLPPLAEQKRIADILSSLDDKIELNNKINANLEAQAQALFKQWFVARCQSDWADISITSLFEIKDGTHDSPKSKTEGKKLITSKYISNNRLDLLNAYNISIDDFNQINIRSKVDSGDILISMIGTIGLVYMEMSEAVDYAIKNVGLLKTSQNAIFRNFTYLWLKSEYGLNFIRENKTGSTQEYITLKSLRSINYSIPNMDYVRDFDNIVSPIFKQVKINQEQIFRLTQLRDTLLSKLMNNEIKI